RLLIDLRDLAALQLDDEQRARVVEVAEALRVRRPARALVVAGPAEGEVAALAVPVLRREHELVLAALVREPGDRLAVRRPDGVALVRAGRLRQVAWVTLLGGHGHDLAAEAERDARAGGRG